uniref:Fibrinogen C-terminal domain-containing protein n=1 Tax=Arion vulgaris TaxID=1028688 RepID=A0A0B6ZF28_9EUPU
MELESYLAYAILLVVLVTSGADCERSTQENDSLHNKLIERMDNIQRQLAEVTTSMRNLDTDIGTALGNCQDKYDFLCKALDVEFEPKNQEDMNVPWGPEKRSAMENSIFAKHRRFYSELFRKSAMINHLLGVFRGADNVLKNERKRTCNLNLGFHCDTEEITDFADAYDFLSSVKSPGKKRSVRGAP